MASPYRRKKNPYLMKAPPAPTPGEIVDGVVDEVSTVDKGANNKVYALIKRMIEGEDPMSEISEELMNKFKEAGFDPESIPETIQEATEALELLEAEENEVSKANKPVQRKALLSFLKDLVARSVKVLQNAKALTEDEQKSMFGSSDQKNDNEKGKPMSKADIERIDSLEKKFDSFEEKMDKVLNAVAGNNTSKQTEDTVSETATKQAPEGNPDSGVESRLDKMEALLEKAINGETEETEPEKSPMEKRMDKMEGLLNKLIKKRGGGNAKSIQEQTEEVKKSLNPSELWSEEMVKAESVPDSFWSGTLPFAIAKEAQIQKKYFG